MRASGCGCIMLLPMRVALGNMMLVVRAGQHWSSLMLLPANTRTLPMQLSSCSLIQFSTVLACSELLAVSSLCLHYSPDHSLSVSPPKSIRLPYCILPFVHMFKTRTSSSRLQVCHTSLLVHRAAHPTAIKPSGA